MKKTFDDETHRLRVQIASHGEVELLHLHNPEKVAGHVICFWKVRDVDEQSFPEIQVVHDRLTASEVSDELLLRALRWGQKYAELLIDTDK